MIRPISNTVHLRNATAEEGESRLTSLELLLFEVLKQKEAVFQPPSAIPADVPFRHVIRLEEGAKPFRSLLTE